MNITIIGAGHAGTTVAADLAAKGHNVTLLKSSNKLHNDNFEAIKNSGHIIIGENGNRQTVSVNTSTDFEKSIPCSDLIIVFIQTNYHEELIKRMVNCLQDGQTVLMEPGYLSTCFFLKHCHKDITVIEAESSPIDCRIIAPGRVEVFFRNVVNPVSVFPSKNKEKALELLEQLELPFEGLRSVAEAALHNPNLIVHTVGAILSVPRIEYVNKHGGTYSMYREVFTDSVWNLVLALDNEKMDVLEKLGCERLAYVDACKHRNSLDINSDATAVFFDYASNSAPDGPMISNSRYVTEDVPQGLVLLESLGAITSTPTPVCTGLINCASALLNTDFRLNGRTVERLGKEELTIALKG